MKFFLFIFILFSSQTSLAGIKGQNFGSLYLITLTSQNYDGSNDGSPWQLFEKMNRPIQESLGNKGKTLLAPQPRILDFICSQRAENNFQCAIYIHRSANARIGGDSVVFSWPENQKSFYLNQFHLSDSKELNWVDESESLYIQVNPEKFVIKFKSKN